jgi:hypothetical protein
MVTRETYPTSYKDCSISVVTEQLEGGRWAAVATVARFSGTAQEVTPVPIPDRRFDSMEAARDYALAAGRDWIDRNTVGA